MLKLSLKQESGQRLVILKEDDPEAVEEILRKIYGCTLPEAKKKPWRFWFNLTVAADKYLSRDEQAGQNLLHDHRHVGERRGRCLRHHPSDQNRDQRHDGVC